MSSRMAWSRVDATTYRCWLAKLGVAFLGHGFKPEANGGHSVLLVRIGPQLDCGLCFVQEEVSASNLACHKGSRRAEWLSSWSRLCRQGR